MADLLAPYAIIMCCECECHKCCCLKVRFCVCRHKDAAATAEGDVFKTERCDVRFGSSVLSWVEEEEIQNSNHVALRLEDGVSKRIGNG